MNALAVSLHVVRDVMSSISNDQVPFVDWRDATPARVLGCETLTGPDLKAFNTFEQPRRVSPQRLDAPAAGARMTFKLPPRSYTVAQLAIGR